jgi:hypothetical protein
MFIETVPDRTSPPAVLLRESYRDEQGRAQKHTSAHLSKLPSHVVDGLEALLKGGMVIGTGLDEMRIAATWSRGAVLGTLSRIALDRLIMSTARAAVCTPLGTETMNASLSDLRRYSPGYQVDPNLGLFSEARIDDVVIGPPEVSPSTTGGRLSWVAPVAQRALQLAALRQNWDGRGFAGVPPDTPRVCSAACTNHATERARARYDPVGQRRCPVGLAHRRRRTRS